MTTPLPVLPGVFYGTLRGTYDGLPSGNVFCFKSSNETMSSDVATASALQVASALTTAWDAHIIALLPSIYLGEVASIYPLQYPLVPAQENTASSTGGASGTVSSMTRVAVIKHNVLRRGRGSQGHTYVSPISDLGMNPDARHLSVAHRDDWQAAYAAFIADVIGIYEAFAPSEILSYRQLSKKGTGATYPIINSQVELAIGSQRRRGRRRSIA
jgi:hypothetical protein